MELAKKKSTVTLVAERAAPLAQELDIQLWDVKFEKEGGLWFLKVLLDKEGGITLDDCEAFSRRLSKLLDEDDPIDQSYYLEVSSAGIDRRLEKPAHFEASIGQRVNARRIRPDEEGNREISGVLQDYDGTCVTIETDDGANVSCEVKQCSYIKWDDEMLDPVSDRTEEKAKNE